MLFVSILVGLLAAALVLAVRELVAFKSDADWQDIGALREKLMSGLPETPHRRIAGRSETIAFCFEMRKEFRASWRLCRFLAPISGDPEYLMNLLRIQVRFYSVLAMALAQATVGGAQACDQLTEQLRGLGSAMRASALAILMSSEVETAGAAA
jgi:hypothetical protein